MITIDGVTNYYKIIFNGKNIRCFGVQHIHKHFDVPICPDKIDINLSEFLEIKIQENKPLNIFAELSYGDKYFIKNNVFDNLMFYNYNQEDSLNKLITRHGKCFYDRGYKQIDNNVKFHYVDVRFVCEEKVSDDSYENLDYAMFICNSIENYINNNFYNYYISDDVSEEITRDIIEEDKDMDTFIKMRSNFIDFLEIYINCINNGEDLRKYLELERFQTSFILKFFMPLVEKLEQTQVFKNGKHVNYIQKMKLENISKKLTSMVGTFIKEKVSIQIIKLKLFLETLRDNDQILEYLENREIEDVFDIDISAYYFPLFSQKMDFYLLNRMLYYLLKYDTEAITLTGAYHSSNYRDFFVFLKDNQEEFDIDIIYESDDVKDGDFYVNCVKIED